MKPVILLVLLLGNAIAEPLSKRFGINAAGQIPAAELAELGVGRVRFENLKWPMVSPAPGEFAYDGSVAPWHVNVDKILADYVEAGIEVLPFLFQTAAYASTAPEGTKESQVYSYPPKDDSDYAEFVWQTVARYGSRKHSPERLKTKDKKSGLGLLKTVEIWNEPNLNAPEWGPWVADMPRYFELLRAGYEAAKKADPNIIVAHGGFAGIDIDTVDQLASYRYADGKSALDFTDIINVHYYSGKVRPERATGDPNVDRSGHNKIDDEKRADWVHETPHEPKWLRAMHPSPTSYEGNLKRLAEWRHEVAPGKPIWMTETGYDTAGPHGITEAEQAARLPRVVTLALAAGVQSVFVYRETGSTPGQHAASGLVRDDGTRKPSWETYRTLIAQLADAKHIRRIRANKVRSFMWRGNDGYQICEWAIEGTATAHWAASLVPRVDSSGRFQTDNSLSESITYGHVDFSRIENKKMAKTLREQLSLTYVNSQGGSLVRQQARETDAKRRTYLFDFGGYAKRKTLYLGRHRRFLPVTKTDTFTAARTFGFEPREAMQDGYRKWIPDFAECDDCRLSKDIAFRIKVKPGRYRLSAGSSPLSKTPITVAVGGKTLVFTPDAPTASVELDITSDEIVYKPDGYLDLRWLTIVETPRD